MDSNNNTDKDLLELLKKASNISSTGIHVVDLETMEMYYCNDAGFRLIGQEPKDYTGKPCYYTFFGIDHPCKECRLFQTKCGEKKHIVYIPQYDKSFLTNTEISVWNNRKVFVEYITDYSDARQKQEKQNELMAKLTASTKELRRKYDVEKRRSRDDKSILAYAVFNLGNGATLEMDRRAPLASLNSFMSMYDFRNDIASCILSDETRRKFEEMFTPSSLISKFRDGTEEQTIEFQRTLPTGKVIWVRTTFHLMPQPDSSDMLLFYYCNDINLRKSLEILTEHIANEDYDMLGCINFRDDSAIMMYGKNSSYAKVSGVPIYREESYTNSLEWFVTNAIVKEERERFRTQFFIKKIREELSENGFFEVTLHVDSTDGKRLTKKIRYVSYDSESDVCLFTQTDITDLLADEEKKQKVLREALLDAKNANNAKSSFLSRMSHDMRTPMNGILGLAVLSEDENDPDLLHENIRKIKESGDYLLSLINDTLDFQKIESGKMSLDRKVVDTRLVLDGILDIIRPAMKKKQIDFEVRNENADLDWFILLDEVRFKQIFINLLSNAVKFTPSGGKVSFIFGCKGRDGLISHDYIKVCDTGVGMSEDFLKNGIFKPFSQENNAISSVYAGSGLGLSIVKSLVELMGGRIEVKSQIGKGTEFTVYIDFQRIEADKAKNMLDDGKKHISDAINQLFSRHILLVEDMPLNAEIARRLLEKAGCEVEIAENGLVSMEMLEKSEKPFDAVLMDIRMPVMDGLSAAKEIRRGRVKGCEALPIIAMTANAYEEDVKNCLDAGMNAHLSKPIDPQKLYETLVNEIKP